MHEPASEFLQRVAQMGSRVLRADQSPSLQRRDERVGDLCRVAAAVVAERTLDQEAVAADFLHHLAHPRCDGIGRTDQLDRRAGAAVGYQLAQRLAAAELLELVERALFAVGRQLPGQRLVELVLREIDVGERAELGQRELDEGGRGHILVEFLAGFRIRLAEKRRRKEQNLDVVRVTSHRGSFGADVVAIGLHTRNAVGHRNDGVGVLGGKSTPGR